jgi:dTDP-4-dehydrorhamnose 3,5-epimerase
MKFIPTDLAGAYVVEPERVEDERGFFARTFCRDQFAAHGLRPAFVQCNLSFNTRKGTLRGMHFQERPHEEAKLIRCTRGKIWDVVADVRRNSPTFGRWAAFELTADNRKMVYVPEGFAHGFQTLEDSCEVFYQMSDMYHPGLARGVRWNDPVFGIHWPLAHPIVSKRDAAYPDLEP